MNKHTRYSLFISFYLFFFVFFSSFNINTYFWYKKMFLSVSIHGWVAIFMCFLSGPASFACNLQKWEGELFMCFFAWICVQQNLSTKISNFCQLAERLGFGSIQVSVTWNRHVNRCFVLLLSQKFTQIKLTKDKKKTRTVRRHVWARARALSFSLKYCTGWYSRFQLSTFCCCSFFSFF